MIAIASPTLDAAAISAAGAMMRDAVAASHLGNAPSDVREGAVAAGVARIMAAGAFARDGVLFLPKAPT